MSAEIISINRQGGRRVAAWRQQVGANPCGTITEHLPRFVEHLRAMPAAPRTIDRYLEAAGQLEDFLKHPDVSTITRADLERFIAHRLETCAGSTVAGNFVSLQQLFKFLVEELAADGFTNPMVGMKKPKFEERPIRVPAAELVAAMLIQTQRERDPLGNRPFEAIRDEFIIRLFCDTGARLSEVTELTVHDNLGDRIRVFGKSKGGGKVERQLAIGPKTQTALRRYLRARSHHPHRNLDRLILSATGKKGVMTPSGVRQMIWRRSLTAGARIHPHQLRHALAHNWQMDGGNEGNLMEIMGWRSPAMLRRYGKSAAGERALTAHRQWLEGRA